ncbi:unnamed protein product [Spirodela intermedia]|uniref:Uncharacterized protein n=1 Tax=Spirodela intermedia TaxID=51605 RepID=A0A7I8L3Z6_SPIIN|nr:unnamed protein product [Spirodela intermedia]
MAAAVVGGRAAAGDGHAAVLSGRAAAGDRRQQWSPSRLLPLLGSLYSWI